MYESKKERAQRFLVDNVVKTVRERDIDYYKLRGFICDDFLISENVAEMLINKMLENNGFKEERIITIGDGQVKNWLKDITLRDRETKEDIKIADEFLDGLDIIKTKKNGRDR